MHFVCVVGLPLRLHMFVCSISLFAYVRRLIFRPLFSYVDNLLRLLRYVFLFHRFEYKLYWHIKWISPGYFNIYLDVDPPLEGRMCEFSRFLEFRRYRIWTHGVLG